jgi:hypothetical protein
MALVVMTFPESDFPTPGTPPQNRLFGKETEPKATKGKPKKRTAEKSPAKTPRKPKKPNPTLDSNGASKANKDGEAPASVVVLGVESDTSKDSQVPKQIVPEVTGAGEKPADQAKITKAKKTAPSLPGSGDDTVSKEKPAKRNKKSEKTDKGKVERKRKITEAAPGAGIDRKASMTSSINDFEVKSPALVSSKPKAKKIPADRAKIAAPSGSADAKGTIVATDSSATTTLPTAVTIVTNEQESKPAAVKKARKRKPLLPLHEDVQIAMKEFQNAAQDVAFDKKNKFPVVLKDPLLAAARIAIDSYGGLDKCQPFFGHLALAVPYSTRNLKVSVCDLGFLHSRIDKSKIVAETCK